MSLLYGFEFLAQGLAKFLEHNVCAIELQLCKVHRMTRRDVLPQVNGQRLS